MLTLVIASLLVLLVPNGEAVCDPNALTFVTIGDWGTVLYDSKADQANVAAAMGTKAAAICASFVISVGDNFYDAGPTSTTDTAWQTVYEKMYTNPSLMVPWYVVLGNHDYKKAGGPLVQIDYSKLTTGNKRWVMPDYYFTKVFSIPNSAATIQFVFIDTMRIAPEETGATKSSGVNPVSATQTSQELAWIETTLAASTATWLVVVGHYQLYAVVSAGDQATMVSKIDPLLIKYGVQVYMSGHKHNLQHMTKNGIQYIVNGQGGSQSDAIGTCPGDSAACPAKFGQNTPGFASFAVTATAISFSFINTAGATLYTTTFTNPNTRTASPTRVPNPNPTSVPIAKPTPIPTAVPLPPTSVPIAKPTSIPTPLPSTPTSVPIDSPTSVPVANPTSVPIAKPTSNPSAVPAAINPTSVPIANRSPTPKPTNMPTPKPTSKPTNRPTPKPTNPNPTAKPTNMPTPNPSAKPTNMPTSKPTNMPVVAAAVAPASSITSSPIMFSLLGVFALIPLAWYAYGKLRGAPNAATTTNNSADEDPNAINFPGSVVDPESSDINVENPIALSDVTVFPETTTDISVENPMALEAPKELFAAPTAVQDPTTSTSATAKIEV